SLDFHLESPTGRRRSYLKYLRPAPCLNAKHPQCGPQQGGGVIFLFYARRHVVVVFYWVVLSLDQDASGDNLSLSLQGHCRKRGWIETQLVLSLRPP
ncbi:unnamed protein product, partial [Ectocarpus sp. 6 AP-2014]